MKTWEELAFWQTGEYQVVQEKLDDLDKKRISYCPKREDLFAALDATPFDKVKVMLCGQDPYPKQSNCTGLAFSLPKSVKTTPPTLYTIFGEYNRDLHYDIPENGDLMKWANEGVLLWNVIPSCMEGASKSHDWVEWELLTKEIIEQLSAKNKDTPDVGVVFIFLGATARKYKKFVDQSECDVIETSHPSPLGARATGNSFIGSRIFTRTNALLGKDAIDWRL